jgi:hypothetical protein
MDCYKCKHRRRIPGDAHSSCAHPAIAGLLSSPLGSVLSIMGGQDFSSRIYEPSITVNSHGVRNGWCSWPFNFDPIWVESCDSFEGE